MFERRQNIIQLISLRNLINYKFCEIHCFDFNFFCEIGLILQSFTHREEKQTRLYIEHFSSHPDI